MIIQSCCSSALTPVGEVTTQRQTGSSSAAEQEEGVKHFFLPTMGNVALQAEAGGGGALTPFQRSKVIFDFEKFFDLNKDGILTYKDFLWAKDRICQMSGWKVVRTPYMKYMKVVLTPYMK